MPVKISISDKTYSNLKLRLTELRLAYGNKIGFKYTDDFAEHLLDSHLEKIRNKKKSQHPNTGTDWTAYRRLVFDVIYERDGGKCCYCSKSLTRTDATIDHIVPPIRGGQNMTENLCVACKWCNGDKGVLTAEEYHYKQLANAAKGIYPPT